MWILTAMNTQNSWIKSPSAVSNESGAPVEIPSGEALSRLVESRVEELIQHGKFTRHDASYVEKLTLRATSSGFSCSPERLDRLRRAAQVWDIELRPREITSHRPVIGPIIVSIKKLVFPILSFFLSDLIRQQRSFNAEILGLVIELSDESGATEQVSKAA